MSDFNLEWVGQYLAGAPRVIFDVGSFDGADAMRMKLRWSGARVVAFEADPRNFARMEAAGQVAASGVEGVHGAVSDREGGEVMFWPNTDKREWNPNGSCSGSILRPNATVYEAYDFLEFHEPVGVPTLRLDVFCRERGIRGIDVLHMDVQAAEGLVLVGLGAMRPGMIFLEIDETTHYDGGMSLPELRALLEKMGYIKVWQSEHDALYVQEGSDALSGLTVCITNFKRAKYLERAIRSCRGAGIRRLAICASAPDEEVDRVLKAEAQGWLSFDVARIGADIGCNATWMLAAYRARTERIIVLHDDDVLRPEFGKAYREKIAPAMNAGCGIASWRPNLLFDDGHNEQCEYWSPHPTGEYGSEELREILDRCLTHSPCVSVLDRQTVIHACKEVETTLTSNDSLERPGMVLGTELVVYYRHAEKFRRWFYLDEILCSFGHNPTSGTIRAFAENRTAELERGYNLARVQARRPKPIMLPRIMFVWFEDPYASAEANQRYEVARATWDFHFNQTTLVEMPLMFTDLTRSSMDMGEKRAVAYVRDLFDLGCARAMPEDIVAYVNRDIGLTSLAPDWLIRGVERGMGVTVCGRRKIDPEPGMMYRSVLNCKTDGGFDIMAVSQNWWRCNRDRMPDMFIGREAWDTVFRTLAEEWADNIPLLSVVSTEPAVWMQSRAYTDDVCWHKPHESYWDANRTTIPSQKHNRALARAFFLGRGNLGIVALIDQFEPGAKPIAQAVPVPTTRPSSYMPIHRPAMPARGRKAAPTTQPSAGPPKHSMETAMDPRAIISQPPRRRPCSLVEAQQRLTEKYLGRR